VGATGRTGSAGSWCEISSSSRPGQAGIPLPNPIMVKAPVCFDIYPTRADWASGIGELVGVKLDVWDMSFSWYIALARHVSRAAISLLRRRQDFILRVEALQ
jgi:hypothetical protein